MLADMRNSLDAARLMIWNAAASSSITEAGFPDPMLAAQAKIVASEAAVKVSNDALQMHGAMGYSRNLPVERMVRDARMFTIGGGTAQMLRNLVASQILDRCFVRSNHAGAGAGLDRHIANCHARFHVHRSNGVPAIFNNMTSSAVDANLTDCGENNVLC